MKEIKNYSTTINKIRKQLKKYIEENNLQSLILGVSGGVDSALCAALAKPVCDVLGIKLYGRSLTIETNKPEEIERARNIGIHFCHDFKEVDLGKEYNIMKFIDKEEEFKNEDNFKYKIRQGNIKARMRMIYLYNLASKHNGMVLSTDNYTEYLCGFWTVMGDCGDYVMLRHLWKTEVYEMTKHIAKNLMHKEDSDSLLDCVDAVPTDGLGITNSDLDQLGASSYEEVDNVLKSYIYEGKNKDHAIIKRHLTTEFKRNWPIVIERFDIV